MTGSKHLLQQEFLETWPVEALQNMTLAQYSRAGAKDTFCYWIESKLEELGSIWGGSAFKFGIFHRKDLSDRTNHLSHSNLYDDEYAWAKKYGDQRDIVFQNIRNIILELVTCAQNGNFDKIEAIDFSPTMKWKIAFLYQSNEAQKISCIYSKKMLKEIAQQFGKNSDRKTTHLELYDFLLKQRKTDEDIFDFSERLWSMKPPQNMSVSPSISQQSPDASKSQMPSKNQILYGAAGTGKTYHTINKALEIVSPEFLDDLEDEYPPNDPDPAQRKKIKDHFDQLVKQNRIQFVTFHQSFSYEDFVEGIGVKLGHEDGTTAGRLDYEVKAGVFKQICEAAQQDNSQPYVLIIDEINRGNISRIFGELITLLEDSKREGEDEALSVTLPYSKEKFSVPSNLYIIGTMNSSDRSLTGLDIALRRRFSFIEMQPNPEVLKDIKVEGVEIEKLLEKMNQRIEVLLDRDHCIGHAYFMPLQQDGSIEKLAEIFAQKIIPLLQEYFYDDWERIAWVLNCNGMLKLKYDEKGLEKLFHKNAHGKLQNHNWDVDNTKLEDIEAYKVIIGSASGNAS